MAGRAVDQHMHGRKGRKDFCRRRRDVGLDPDIAGEREPAPPGLGYRVAGGLRGAGVEIDAGDVGAGTREGERNCAPDTGARAGDDRVFVGKRESIVHGGHLTADPAVRGARRYWIFAVTLSSLVLSCDVPAEGTYSTWRICMTLSR